MVQYTVKYIYFIFRPWNWCKRYAVKLCAIGFKLLWKVAILIFWVEASRSCSESQKYFLGIASYLYIRNVNFFRLRFFFNVKFTDTNTARKCIQGYSNSKLFLLEFCNLFYYSCTKFRSTAVVVLNLVHFTFTGARTLEYLVPRYGRTRYYSCAKFSTAVVSMPVSDTWIFVTFIRGFCGFDSNFL
jgi:hypothetical protein